MTGPDVPPPPEGRPPQDWSAGQPGTPPPAPAPGGFSAPFAYAGFGERLGAFLLDGLFAVGAVLVVFLVAGLVRLVLGVVSDPLGAIVGGLIGFAGYLAVLVVLMLMEAGPYGQTPGKHLLGIRVVDTAGQTITKGAAVGRYFAKILSGLPCYLGYLWALWDSEKRTFHDMLVNTRVVAAADKAPSLVALVQAPFTGRRA